MSNADQASEPTMEEILSSIRKIISDDDKGAGPPAAKAAAKPRPAPPPVAKVEPAAEPEPEAEMVSQSAADDIFDLTEVVEEVAAEEAPADDWDIAEEGLLDPDTLDDVGFSDPAPEPEPEPEPAPAPVIERPAPRVSRPPMPRPEPLLSSEATDAASAAFGDLANTLLSRNGDARTLEELVQEMLRPMLQAWLNQNLPPMVERLVREEIERVTRRR